MESSWERRGRDGGRKEEVSSTRSIRALSLVTLPSHRATEDRQADSPLLHQPHSCSNEQPINQNQHRKISSLSLLLNLVSHPFCFRRRDSHNRLHTPTIPLPHIAKLRLPSYILLQPSKKKSAHEGQTLPWSRSPTRWGDTFASGRCVWKGRDVPRS